MSDSTLSFDIPQRKNNPAARAHERVIPLYRTAKRPNNEKKY